MNDSKTVHDHETKLSAYELILYRNALQDFANSDECRFDEKSKVEKEIYYTNLLIEVRTVQDHKKYGVI